MKTFSLNDIKNGSLVNSVKAVNVEFMHDGELHNTDILLKTLPYAQTEQLYQRLQNVQHDSHLMAEWIALCLVDEQHQTVFTADDVLNYFTLPLVIAVFNAVVGLDTVEKDEQGKSDLRQTMS